MTIHGLTVGHAPLSHKLYASAVDNHGQNNNCTLHIANYHEARSLPLSHSSHSPHPLELYALRTCVSQCSQCSHATTEGSFQFRCAAAANEHHFTRKTHPTGNRWAGAVRNYFPPASANSDRTLQSTNSLFDACCALSRSSSLCSIRPAITANALYCFKIQNTRQSLLSAGTMHPSNG